MKKQIKKWLKRTLATILLIFGILLVIVLNPRLSYAHKTVHGQYRVYHNKPVDQSFLNILDNASRLAAAGEFYRPGLKLDVCLNDGSRYPWLVEKLGGRAFARGFYNKVVLMSSANYAMNYSEINGRRWNLTELLAHEMTHCIQFNHLGFWHSKPVAGIPNWKWEGYPEYIARQDASMRDLPAAITRLLEEEKQPGEAGWMELSDGNGVVTTYYRDWLMVKYCIEIKKMSYADILADTTTGDEIWRAMMNWYQAR